MEHSYIAEYEHVKIRPLKETDIELLRQWRNDPQISRYLHKIPPITQKMQRIWYNSYLLDPNIFTFAIEETRDLNRVVGSVALYDFKGDTVEIGKIMVGDPEASGRQIGYYAKLLCMHVAFEKMQVNTIFTEVHEQNMPAKVNDIKIGFSFIRNTPFDSGGYELNMKMSRQEFQEKQPLIHAAKIQG